MEKPHSPWLLVANTAHSPGLLALISCARPRYILSVVRVTKLGREAVFITTWACSEVLGFWCGYVLPISVLDRLALVTVLGIANRNPTLLISLNWLPLTNFFFFLFISLCVPLPTVPFSLASLCLSGSIRQCSHLFFTFHLPSVLSIVSVVLDFVLSPFPLAFNVLVSDVTMHLISQAGNHQVVIDLFSSTSSWFSMKGCSCPAPYLHPHPVSPTPRPRLFQYPGYFYQFFVF